MTQQIQPRIIYSKQKLKVPLFLTEFTSYHLFYEKNKIFKFSKCNNSGTDGRGQGQLVLHHVLPAVSFFLVILTIFIYPLSPQRNELYNCVVVPAGVTGPPGVP